MKKKKKYKLNFSTQTKESEINVEYFVYNEKVVKCIVYEYNKIFQECYEFKAKAVCNTKEGDIFDIVEGANISLEKALDKRDSFYLRIVKEIESSNYNIFHKILKIRNNRDNKYIKSL